MNVSTHTQVESRVKICWAKLLTVSVVLKDWVRATEAIVKMIGIIRRPRALGSHGPRLSTKHQT